MSLLIERMVNGLADGSIYATPAAFSTCDADPLHWE